MDSIPFLVQVQSQLGEREEGVRKIDLKMYALLLQIKAGLESVAEVYSQLDLVTVPLIN